jgi:hypothetical protein
VTTFRTATLEEYRCLHPDDDQIPPLITPDGHISAVGTAHGRTIPVIGSTRPPVYDVSLHPMDGSDIRIYADDPNDVLAVICGAEYQQQLDRCKDLIARYEAIDDETPNAATLREELTADFAAETTFLGLICGVFAHKARAIAQGKINNEAQQDGRWERLTPQEQEILISAADTSNPKAPIGVLRDAAFDDPNNPGQMIPGKRGSWTADVDLVLNEVDYYPWSPVPLPLSSVLIEGPNGEIYEDDVSNLNLRIISVYDADDLLEALDELNVISLTIRPVVPVDPLYRDGYADSVNNRVNANKAATAEQ